MKTTQATTPLPPLPVWRLTMPANWRGGVLCSSVHSGRYYPPELRARTLLGARALRGSEDAFVDRLLVGAQAAQLPLLRAVAARAWVDLNRGADELDPALIKDAPRMGFNPRLNMGLGVIPRVVAVDQPIQQGKITLVEAQQRLAQWYHPFHAQLTSLLRQARANTGQAVLLDWHSMPAEASPADVVLGDAHGNAASLALREAVAALFRDAGLRVAINAPFAGGFITRHYGRPTAGVQVIQIELNRGLYLDAARLVPNANFGILQRTIGELLPSMAVLVPFPRTTKAAE